MALRQCVESGRWLNHLPLSLWGASIVAALRHVEGEGGGVSFASIRPRLRIDFFRRAAIRPRRAMASRGANRPTPVATYRFRKANDRSDVAKSTGGSVDGTFVAREAGAVIAGSDVGGAVTVDAIAARGNGATDATHVLPGGADGIALSIDGAAGVTGAPADGGSTA